MKITAVEPKLYHVPLPEVMTDARHGEMRHFSLITASIRTEDGATGIGYTYTVGTTGGAAILALLRDLVPALVGEDPRGIAALWEKMWWRLHFVGRGGAASFAIAAADVALWDLKAKLAGEPLWRFLGGAGNRVRVYAGGIDLRLSLDQLQEQTRRNLERGFRAIKMKVGRERLAEDLERVAAMRTLLGGDIPLLVDANMGWTTEQAIRASRALAKHDVYWLEEPTIPDDFDGYARIESEGALPVAAGENFHSLYEFRHLLGARGVSFPEPDAATLGGITPWLQVAQLAQAHNLPVTSHGVHDIHVHLLCAVPNASFLEAHGFGLEPYLVHKLPIEDGFAIAPDRPGHGIELNWHALEPYRVN